MQKVILQKLGKFEVSKTKLESIDLKFVVLMPKETI